MSLGQFSNNLNKKCKVHINFQTLVIIFIYLFLFFVNPEKTNKTIQFLYYSIII